MAFFETTGFIIEGAGAVTPQFAPTVLADNTDLLTSFTLSDDFENYDFLEFEITSTSLGTIRIVTLPCASKPDTPKMPVVFEEVSPVHKSVTV